MNASIFPAASPWGTGRGLLLSLLAGLFLGPPSPGDSRYRADGDPGAAVWAPAG